MQSFFLQASCLNDLLQHLPPITDAHREALNAVLIEAACVVHVPVAELQRRRDFAQAVCSALEARVEGMGLFYHYV